MAKPILAQLAALKTAPVAVLKQRWRYLFDSEPPAYNRRYLESRLAYRIQELAYGGLKPATVAKLEKIADEIEKQPRKRRSHVERQKPIAGTRLLREWQGIEHCVTVRRHDFEYQGRPYQSLSSIARLITGTRWNGWVFFGLQNTRARR